MKRLAGQLFNLVVLLCFSAGLFYVANTLYSTNNASPASYHPDELGKASQILDGTRNYNHPQLMLEATLLMLRFEQTPVTHPVRPPSEEDDEATIRGDGNDVVRNLTDAFGNKLPPDRRPTADEVVLVGRRTSAALSALAAVLLAAAGYFACGWAGFILVGTSCVLCPSLLAHAHYFKEEASLVVGMSAVLCVGAAFARRRHTGVMLPLALLLGVACGLAGSGKYVGLIMFPLALVLTVATCWGRWWTLLFCLLLVVSGSLSTWGIVNYRAVDNWDAFLQGFNREYAHGLEGHTGVSLPKFTTFFLDLVWQEATPPVRWLAIFAPAVLLLMRRRRSIERAAFAPRSTTSKPVAKAPTAATPGILFAWWAVLCFVIFAGLLSVSTIPFFRYALPLSVMACMFAGLSAAWLALSFSTNRRTVITVAAFFFLFLAVSGRRCLDYLDQFKSDSRDAVAEWVATLPEGTRILADGYTQLPERRGRWSGDTILVLRPRFAADNGPLRLARRRQINYVIVTGSCFDRFLNPHTIPSPTDSGTFYRYYAFYEELFRTGKIVKKWTADHPMYTFTNPDTYVIEINPPRERRAETSND